jgi:hypothetical protein
LAISNIEEFEIDLLASLPHQNANYQKPTIYVLDFMDVILKLHAKEKV